MHSAHWLTNPNLVNTANVRLLTFVVGALLLAFGRRLFWLFLGAVGFFTVYQVSLAALHIHPLGVRLFLACLAGLFGVLLALFVQRVAVALAGFTVGVWLGAMLLGLDLASLASLTAIRPVEALVILVAGALGAILGLRLFELALVACSSLVGAGLIADAAHLASPTRSVLLVLLTTVGIVFQITYQAVGGGRRRARAR